MCADLLLITWLVCLLGVFARVFSLLCVAVCVCCVCAYVC